ncbi:SITS-binding protein [Alligator mississippiensis]|uniref:SITS-binding protein-like n=1 Tax=Alligator mississippiensis TaxID=8496 RepID=A0A151NXS8_ALLMI|nr:SITS-binding protein [Alligator mississippiensis]KYO41584.1 SITS-binding protein-like [Alligator mississippiensis]
MPHTRPRNPSPIPEVTWDSGFKEMNETWKGAIACLGVAVFFVMTIGIIYWQVVDQPNKNWIVRGSTSGLIWERRSHSLILQTLSEEKTVVEIDVGNFPDMELPFVKNLCWLNKTEFCYTWDDTADLKISFEPGLSVGTECYSIYWTPLHCELTLKDCFSMTNISWYGGASVSAQRWPLNNMNAKSQPYIISNLNKNPIGYGPVLERYFLGSTGVTVTIAPDVPVFLSVESNKHFCLESPSSIDMIPLQYMVCISQNITSAHQEVGSQLSEQERRLPNTDILGLPIWKYYGAADSAAKLERGLRSFFNRLKRHHLGEGLIAINEHSTMILSNADHTHLPGTSRKMHSPRHSRDLSLIKPLKLSITLSPYISISSQLFLMSLQEGKENYWLSLHSEFDSCSAPLLTTWKGQFSVRLNVTSNAAVSWYLERVSLLLQKLGATYVTFEGGEGNMFLEQAIHPPRGLEGDKYVCILALMASTLGNSTIISAGTRSNHLPLFVQMSSLQSDWSYAGLKSIIPSVLHYSLLGYNFFIPDAVGGTLTNEFLTDEELYIRWLQIVTFLPVMSFSTPPWVCCDDWVLNLTRQYIQRHQEFVVPLILKYSEEWLSMGYPIFRPVWWLSPNDPITFTVDDEFLIGDEVLIAPITEQGQVQRDIYLPGEDHLWMDTNTAQVFDGGTVIRNYSVKIAEVPVFVKVSSMPDCPRFPSSTGE